MKQTLQAMALTGLLALTGCGNRCEIYTNRSQQPQIEGIVSNVMVSAVKRAEDVSTNYGCPKTFAFNIGSSPIVVDETRAKPYDVLAKEMQNGDKVKVTLKSRENNPFGCLVSYTADSDKIEILEKAHK